MFVDESGLLHRGAEWVALSPIQERLVRALLERAGQLVPREELVEAGWGGVASPRALDVAMSRLRLKVAGMGIVIHTIRARGFLLAITL